MESPTKIIETAIIRLYSKLKRLEIEELPISAYNKNYLKSYLGSYKFLMFQYQQMMVKAIQKLSKPIEKSVFIDYGGGCGMLSYLAKEVGFRNVIYNDLYEVSVNDAKIIAAKMEMAIDEFICGDVQEMVKYLEQVNIEVDLICSFDVLEHIYDLKQWFRSIVKIDHRFSLVFTTAANPENPFITNRLMKLHRKVELKGILKDEGWKEIDLSTAYFEERKKIIANYNDELTSSAVEYLAKMTRGLRKEDILMLIDQYTNAGEINYEIDHPTNTCDPYTGNWAEHLINLKKLKIFLESLHLEVDFTNSYYGYSSNKLLNAPKFILNFFIKILGKNHLFFSPTYTLEVQKTDL